MNNNVAKQLFESTMKVILSKHGKLFEFLSLVSRLNQFKTVNLILIYAQCPDAKMLDTLEGWNAHKRVVKEESKAIAILKKKSIHYVFDLQDTSGEDIQIVEDIKIISAMDEHLEKAYREKVFDHQALIEKEKVGTLLEEIEEDILVNIFEKTVKAIATIIIEKYLETDSSVIMPNDLEWIPSFNSTKTGYILLSSAITVAKEVIKTSTNRSEIKDKSNLSEDFIIIAKEKLKKDLKENEKDYLAKKSVFDYLQSVLTNDFSKRILLKEKSLTKCWDYILKKAMEKANNNVLVMSDQDVYNLAVKYFETDLKSDTEVNERPLSIKSDTTIVEKKEIKKVNNQLSFLGDNFNEKK